MSWRGYVPWLLLVGVVLTVSVVGWLFVLDAVA